MKQAEVAYEQDKWELATYNTRLWAYYNMVSMSHRTAPQYTTL